jgi:hypothetical protein
MPLHFEASQGCAIDRINGLQLFHTRMEPRNPGEAEYQFAIYRGDKWYAFSCYGVCRLMIINWKPTRINSMNLGRDWLLDAILRIKKALGVDGTDLEFVHGLAVGITKTFESRSDNVYEVDYTVVATRDSLTEKGMDPGDRFPPVFGTALLLSDFILKANGEKERSP